MEIFMKIRICFLLFAAMLVGALVGCGQEEGSVSVEVAATAVSTQTLTPPTTTPLPTATASQTPIPTATETAVPPTATPSATSTATAVPPQRYYVSKNGNNSDGLSWETAWNELDQIDWRVIAPNSYILLDGGVEQMVYQTPLIPRSSGTEQHPILIQLADEAGRDGQAIIRGERPYPLPYCDQPSVDNLDVEWMRHGILLDEVAWVVVDGRKWRGIVIEGVRVRGIDIKPDTNHLTLRNLEIHDVGFAKTGDDGYFPNGTGITVNGTNHLFERLIIHDNGHDAIQSDGETLAHLTIRESWLYNSVPHPVVTDQSANYCTHTDAFQIHAGGVVEQIIIEESVLGPGFTNTLLFGDKVVDVNDVTLRDVLILKGAENNISAHSTATVSVNNWTLQNVTVYSPLTAFNAITYKGVELTIEESIFVGGHINIPNEEPMVRGNCQWETTGVEIGVNVDPKFTTAVADAFSTGLYEPQNEQCIGSSIFSPEMLLERP